MYSNIILSADSYKYSQFNQYPEGTQFVYSYIESRGGDYDTVIYFGLQAFLKEYLVRPVTMADIDEAEAIITAHGEPFNREGWEYIVKQHEGRLPVEIRGLPEGIKAQTGIPLVTIVNTDPKAYWLTSFLETALLRAVWYPTTVASNSYRSKQIIKEYLEKTGDVAGLSFKLHDFGARGVSSMESAGLGGAAHLVNFLGTDTVTGLLAARKYYGADMAGFSIPAMEHSTVTSWGRENESSSYRNMLSKYAKQGAVLAAVSDSYNIFDAADRIWGQELKAEVVNSGATVVIRPDSGDPVAVNRKLIQILGNRFGYTVNAKGFKVLNNVRIIQGDGITNLTIRSILGALAADGWSADNIAFGQGGALLQQVNRDTMKFAMKCSAIMVNGEWRDVYKDPVGDSSKKSKRGRFSVIRASEDEGDGLKCVDSATTVMYDLLETRFIDGELRNETTFEEVRALAA